MRAKKTPTEVFNVLLHTSCNQMKINVELLETLELAFEELSCKLKLFIIPLSSLSFRIAVDPRNRTKTYNELLKESDTFRNPGAIENLYRDCGLDPSENYTLMSSKKYPSDEYAKELRQQQAGKLAFR